MDTTNRLRAAATLLALLTTLAGCTRRDADPVPERGAEAPPVTAEPKSESRTDAWLGQWTGPEGTFLHIEGGHGQYQITIQDLDGPRVYRGTAQRDRIVFERNGVTESLGPTDGAGTGMKWLADKTDCLTVRVGEGYCRG
jgi:hypothetical protein